MKSTEQFKTIIENHLKQIANSDKLFAKSFAKATKNIDDCVIYILNTVKKSGCNGFADEEIFGMAMHYYDEDNIEVGKPISSVNIVTNQKEKSEPIKKERKKDPDNYPHEQLSMF
jgi:hypothetical protein